MQINSNSSKKITKFEILPDTRVFFAIIFVFIGVLGRTALHFGENIEFVTSVTLLSAGYLGFFYAISVPFLIMLTSDLIIGNTNIFLFTWSAYLMTGILGFIFLKKYKTTVSQVLTATFSGILSSAFFYIWTNYGVWLLDSFGMYPNDISGLVDSYIMGIPFFGRNLISNLFLVPCAFIVFRLVLKIRTDIIVKNKFSLSNSS